MKSGESILLNNGWWCTGVTTKSGGSTRQVSGVKIGTPHHDCFLPECFRDWNLTRLFHAFVDVYYTSMPCVFRRMVISLDEAILLIQTHSAHYYDNRQI